MEMESLPPADHTETAEPESASKPPSYRDAQVWKEIEAETGFASCADYLDFYKDVRPDFKHLLERYRNSPEDSVAIQNAFGADESVIYDLSKQENLPVDLSLRRHCHSGTELIQALREPPSNVCLQLVLWVWDGDLFNQEMTDALVLGLKLDPQFLRDLDSVNRGQRPRAPNGFQASQIKDTVGNGIAAILSQNFMPEDVNAVPVLLVAINDHLPSDGIPLEEVFLAGGDKGIPRIKRSALGESNAVVVTEGDGLKQIGQIYAKIVEDFIVQRRFATPTRAPTQAFLLLAATLPLLDAEAYRMRRILNEVKSNYYIIIENESDDFQLYSVRNNDLDRQRLELRRTLEEAEDYVSQTFRYLSYEVDSDWSKEPSYVSIREDWKSLIDEARRLEIEVRDYMQLQVGNLSLEESRRSIELSNIQIRESKSGEFQTKSLATQTNIL